MTRLYPGWMARCSYRVAQQFMVLDVTHLLILGQDQLSLPEPTDSEVTFRFLTADDVRHFAFNPENELDPGLASRLVLGRDACFGAMIGDRLAAYAWIAFGSIESTHNRGSDLRSGVALSFPDHQAFLYKAYTHPDFRGRQLYSGLSRSALRALSARGITELILTADWTNRSALGSCTRAGCRSLGKIWRWGWGQLLFTRTPRAARRLGIRFGRRAVVQSRDFSGSPGRRETYAPGTALGW